MRKRDKKVPRLSLRRVAEEVAAVTKYSPKQLTVVKTDDSFWVMVKGTEDQWGVYRDLKVVRRVCLEDLTQNLIREYDDFMEVDYFEWSDVYKALSTVVDWNDLCPWVIAESRSKGVDEDEHLAGIRTSVTELCCDGKVVDYEAASWVLYRQGRLTVDDLAHALLDLCGGLAGYVGHVDRRVLVTTPSGLVAELDESHVLDDAPRVGAEEAVVSPGKKS